MSKLEQELQMKLVVEVEVQQQQELMVVTHLTQEELVELAVELMEEATVMQGVMAVMELSSFVTQSKENNKCQH